MATCAAFAPTGRVAVTGSRDNVVLVWEMPTGDEVKAPPLKGRLSLVERSLDAGARQVRVWADLDLPEKDADPRFGDLTPGGTATIVVHPEKNVADKGDAK